MYHAHGKVKECFKCFIQKIDVARSQGLWASALKYFPRLFANMNLNEASAWIKGERSNANIVPQEPYDTWQVRVAQADAASVQQAYFVLRAHREGLLNETRKDRCQETASET